MLKVMYASSMLFSKGRLFCLSISGQLTSSISGQNPTQYRHLAQSPGHFDHPDRHQECFTSIHFTFFVVHPHDLLLLPQT
jgi:hypothetical protein